MPYNKDSQNVGLDAFCHMISSVTPPTWCPCLGSQDLGTAVLGHRRFSVIQDGGAQPSQDEELQGIVTQVSLGTTAHTSLAEYVQLRHSASQVR